jgi:hypothetical protein
VDTVRRWWVVSKTPRGEFFVGHFSVIVYSCSIPPRVAFAFASTLLFFNHEYCTHTSPKPLAECLDGYRLLDRAKLEGEGYRITSLRII